MEYRNLTTCPILPYLVLDELVGELQQLGGDDDNGRRAVANLTN